MAKGLPKCQPLSSITSYQRSILNNLGYFALSRHYVHRSKSGEYSLKSSPILQKISFFLTVANSAVKVVYVLYLICAKLSEVEFLDKITALLYLLVFSIMSISYSIWLNRYPLYEIAHRAWAIEESINSKLGKPERMSVEVNRRLRITVWIHLAITWVGCICFFIQYQAFPKYYTFTYALFESENTILFLLCGLSEFMFMEHAWSLMTGSNCLFTFQGIVLTNLIGEMEAAVHRLQQIEQQKFVRLNFRSKVPLKLNDAKENSDPELYKDVDEVISDYKNLMLLTEEYNKSVSYKVVFLHICGYAQFVSDVFLAVQILRLPGTGIWDIWFYIEDSLASMYMIYRVYEFMSQVEPASQNFFDALRSYQTLPFQSRERKRRKRTMKTLKLISLKLGPCPVRRETVLNAMEILANYYICVALW